MDWDVDMAIIVFYTLFILGMFCVTVYALITGSLAFYSFLIFIITLGGIAP